MLLAFHILSSNVMVQSALRQAQDGQLTQLSKILDFVFLVFLVPKLCLGMH